MNNTQALASPGAIVRGAGLVGLYGGSALITLALVALLTFGDGSLREVASHGLSSLVDVLVSVMSSLGAVVRLI
ncbi:MAG: hypothetical protein JOZ42_00540 [Acetobacteraceae bacterium]|nr:hypothetical protein [Acetobacteraceae bacterium]